MSQKSKDTGLAIQMPFAEAIERLARVNTKDIITETETATVGAAPFVKWAGGKRSIIHELVLRLPPEFKDYWEPFAGGAALFFEIDDGSQKAHLSDINIDLMITYQIVKTKPDALIELLERHSAKHCEDYYYKIRGQFNQTDPVALAARFLYLNKTCYNGLYRVNKRGEFNVPMGRYVNPGIVAKENIRACSFALKNSIIEYRQFDTIEPQTGDFVYCDPPYHPTDDNSFTGYTKLDFTEQDQIRLRDFALKLHNAGVKVMLSNSDTKFIRKLYSNAAFHIETVQAPRFINCKPAQRSSVNEIIITNY